MSTHEILRPFKPWGNCSIQDIKLNKKISRTKRYFPMDAPSLAKSSEMPSVGALYPRRYSERGYWWWKAQEIRYALRPLPETLQAFHSKFENKLSNMIAFQIRRTDKTQGCAEIYGMSCYAFQLLKGIILISLGRKSVIKCKKEANAPKLSDFINSLKYFKVEQPILIQIVTDDFQIFDEMLALNSREKFTFLPPEPAPKRIPDKVIFYLPLFIFLTFAYYNSVRQGWHFQAQGLQRCP